MLGASIIAPHVASVLAGYKLESLKAERQTLIVKSVSSMSAKPVC